MPGDKVLVYRFVNIFQPMFWSVGTIICRYGKLRRFDLGPYEDLCDIQFEDRISHGHFTNTLRKHRT